MWPKQLHAIRGDFRQPFVHTFIITFGYHHERINNNCNMSSARFFGGPAIMDSGPHQ